MKIVTFGNFLINLFLSSSLQFVWGMINAQQIIVHLPLLDINFPQNAKSLFGTIYSLTTFQLVPSETIIKGIYNFKDDNSYNKKFEEFDIF